METRGFGGMPGPPPKIEPIVTFKDIKKGLKVKAIKNKGLVFKGDIFTIIEENSQSVTLKEEKGKQVVLSPLEVCLEFIQVV